MQAGNTRGTSSHPAGTSSHPAGTSSHPPRDKRWAALTIASKSYLSLARVTARSFRQHHPEIPFYLLLTDRCDGFFDPGSEPFELIEAEAMDLPGLDRLASRYSQQALSYALTPHAIRHLLQQGHDGVLFLKQESLVLDRLDPLWDELPHASLMLTPHLLEPSRCPDPVRMELDVLRAGVYNGGVVLASASPQSLCFLDWWARQTETTCEVQLEHGLHYEQRWLDLAPAMLSHCRIIRDPGVNVGHWNLDERAIEMDGTSMTAMGRPCRLFRFSGYDPDVPGRITKYPPLRTLEDYPGAAPAYRHYHRLLMEEGFAQTRHWPYALADAQPQQKEAP